MDVQVSAERLASPRSQRSGRSTDDSLQLSMRSAVCYVYVSDDRSRASHHAFKRLCLR